MNPRDALSGWKEQLAPLARELREGLLPWLQRLDLAVGPMAAEDPLADGDPDGFLGLSRRGPYERLLLSEWLLASEVPDEFLRRAAAGEHAFLELARRSEAGSRVAAALFDAGPSQIGSPRLAHLALLLVLERRARLAGASFFWGVLQQPGVLRESVAPDQALHLLAGRSRQDATRELLDKATAAPPLRKARRELWIVGGPTACSLAPGPCIEVIEPVTLELTSLQVRLRRADRSSLSVELPLPPEAQRLRILRDPFERPATTHKRKKALATGAQRSLFFSSNGRRLFVGLDGGGVLSYPVPNSPYQSNPGEPTTIRPSEGREILAVGWEKNQGVVLQRAGNRLWLRAVGRKGGQARPDRAFDGSAVEWGEGPATALHTITGPRGGRGYAWLTPRGQYVCIDVHGKVRVRQDAIAVGMNHFRTILACRDAREEGVFFEVEGIGENAENERLKTTLSGEIGEVFFGYAEGGHRHPELVLCGVESKDTEGWALYCAYDRLSYLPLSIPASEEAVGVFQTASAAVLLALSKDRRRLLGHGERGVMRMAEPASPIVAVATSFTSTTLAYLTEEQELVIQSTRYSEPVLRVKHGS
jgi:hypothetical protein